MKKIILILIVVVVSVAKDSFSQNLVPNSSFEQHDTCPNGGSQITFSKGWYSSNLSMDTPDYFNVCSSSTDVGIPQNIYGWQNPINGNAYAGIMLWADAANSPREYLQAQLMDTLIVGKKYYVSFYVSLADNMKYACNNVGVYFTQTSVSQSSSLVLPYIPQINNDIANELINKNQWILVADTFTAKGGGKYIVIGNFNDNANSNIVSAGNGGSTTSWTYYYIDEIQVYTNDSLNNLGIIETPFSNSILLSPNPAAISFHLTFSNWQVEKMKMEIFDVLGKSILQSEIHKAQEEINISDFPKGVYYLKISSEGKTAVKKFMKM